MRSFLFILLFILVCISSLIFFAQNNQDVTLSYFIGESEQPLAFIMVGCLIVGYLIGLLSLSSTIMRHKVRARSAEKKLEQSKAELENLRSMPVRDNY
ncbi:MAG: LapA family protein [Gammaproteobacteria bacterium]|nr:LapA family protein [Gammaproteobacteria bacterium]